MHDEAMGFLEQRKLRLSSGTEIDVHMVIREQRHWSAGRIEVGTALYTLAGRPYMKRPGCEPVVTYPEVLRDLFRWHEGMVDPDDRAALARVSSTERSVDITVARALEDIPGTPICGGDVVLVGDSLDSVETVGRVVPLSMEDYKRVRAHIRSDPTPLKDITPKGWGWRAVSASATQFFLCEYWWGKRLKVWRPRAFVVKAVRPSRVLPVAARSELGAIFELLAEAGCRMPTPSSVAR